MSRFNQFLSKRLQGASSSIIRDLLVHSKAPGMISLAGGIPASDMFDMEGIANALAVATASGVESYQYSVTDGEPSLRQAITTLLKSRHISAQPEEIVITSGSQQALDLVIRSLFNEGDIAAVERPTYLAALQVFRLAGATLLDVAGDADGIVPEILEEQLQQRQQQGLPNIKALYVVPNFANPTGSTLTLARRCKLVELARDYQFLIIEDDPYGEIRFTERREPSLYEISQMTPQAAGHVIYLSSFSKVLVPGLRVGFLVAHPELRQRFVIAKQAFDLHCSVLSQQIVSAYLNSNRLEQRIPILRQRYQERAQMLIEALNQHLADYLVYHQPEGGMFLWARLQHNIDAEALLPYAVAEKVVFVPGSAFYCDQPDKQAMRLSFATINQHQAEEAALRLKRAIQHYLSDLNQ